MIILAIDTSCDDTSIALVKATGKKWPYFNILSNIISSQVKIHRKWGGVYPTLAKREHQRNLVPVLIKALEESGVLKNQKSKRTLRGASSKNQKCPLFTHSKLKIKKLKGILGREETLYTHLIKFLKKCQKPKVDLIAVTVGPGLEPCLWVGVNFARALAYFWELPIIPVNHIEAHIFANWLTPISSNFQFSIFNFRKIFPAVCLVVSGGHTQLILMRDFEKYKILGETRDDAAGECFDKVARILGLGYPGGPVIAAKAAKFPISNFQFPIKLPRPMIHSKDYDFSFSGLKTAVLYQYQKSLIAKQLQGAKRPVRKIKTSKKYIQEMAAEVQQAIIDVLINKALRAVKEYKAKSIILGGGVAANDELRKQFQSAINNQQLAINFLVPPKIFCTDNAAMIAATAYFHWLKGEVKTWKDVEAKANLRLG